MPRSTIIQALSSEETPVDVLVSGHQKRYHTMQDCQHHQRNRQEAVLLDENVSRRTDVGRLGVVSFPGRPLKAVPECETCAQLRGPRGEPDI